MSLHAEELRPELFAPARRVTIADSRLAEDTNLLVIEAHPGWHFVDAVELWKCRELLYFLVWRDVKVRYKQTFLGVAWVVLQPFATMVVFSLFFSRIGATTSATCPYPLFVFAGIIPWIFFANAINSAGQSIVANQNLVTKIYFPRLLIPISAAGVGLFDLSITFGMLLVLMLSYGIVPGWGLLLAPPLILGLVIAALGVGIFLSALTVAYRDFRSIVPFMTQLWMFATPCLYMQDDALTLSRWRALLPLNPAYGLIANLRQAILDGPIDGYSLAVSLSVGLALLVVGCLYFRKVERGFADIV